jgi:DNA-binding SARP family transcriptional activator
VISADRLVEEFWDADPPETGRHTMQSCVYRLRQALGADAWRLETRPPGYQLKVSADELDARRFQELAEQGWDALAGGRPEVAAGLLGEALHLWRGPALADLLDSSALAGERARLEGMRLTVVEDRVEADLAVGRSPGGPWRGVGAGAQAPGCPGCRSRSCSMIQTSGSRRRSDRSAQRTTCRPS